jgi:hypothetical protein
MRYRFLTIMLLSVLSLSLAVAQEDKDKEKKEELRPRREPRRFGAAGGFMPMWAFPNMDDINTQLTAANMPAFSNSGIYTSGGAGYAYILFVPNLRVGGIGGGGSTKVSRTIRDDIRQFQKEAEYSISYGGVIVEYAVPIFAPRLSLLFGAMLGGGSIRLDVSQSDAFQQWNKIWDDAKNNGSTATYKRRLSTDFFSYQPYVAIEYGITGFIGIRAGVGYLGNTSADWKVDDISLSNVPSGIKTNGLIIQTGIFFGAFPD